MNEHFRTVEYYKELINKFLTHKLTSEEQKTLLEWLELSEENKKLFRDTRRVFELSLISGIKGKFDIDKIQVWERISERMKGYDTSDVKDKKVKRYRLTSKIIRVAASFLIVFFIAALVSWWVTKSNSALISNNFTNEIIVPNGGKSQVILPDGTQVWLNAGTIFRYEGSYGTKNRNVFLQGEAYFHVKTNRKIPFIVQTSELKIKAIGTSFDVKAYPEEKYISTTLDEGIVKIEGKGINLSMKPKQNITYCKKRKEEFITKPGSGKELQATTQPENGTNSEPSVKETSNVNTQIYTAWKDNKWIIDSENLYDIGILLERKFNISVHIESPELLNYKFTGIFNQETLEQILKVIRLSAPLNYKIENGIVTLQVDKKRKANYLEVLTP